MAGEFDDLIPGKKKPLVGGDFSDLIPATPTPEQLRAERLKKAARGALDFGEGTPGASDLFSNAYTLGLQKPVGALAGAIGGELGEWFGGEPASFGERWKAGTGAYQERMDEARKNAGWAGTGAELAGSVITGGPARNLVQQAGTKLLPSLGEGANLLERVRKGSAGLIGQSALLGGVEGAAENAEDVGSAVKGGIGGAAFSAGTTGLLGGLLDYAKRLTPGARGERAIQREIARGPDPNAIRQGARDIYKQLDDAGIAYDVAQSSDLADTVMTDLVQGKGGWDPEGAHSVLTGVVKRIEGLRGKPVSLATLQQIREQAGASAVDPHPSVRNAAGRILSAIDGYVTNVDPAQSGLAAGQEVGPLWQEARKLWRTANTIEDLNWRIGKAERRAASTNSGQNEENAIRQNIRSVVDKATQPGRFNPYSPPEIAQMERVVEGTPAQNWLRRGGNFVAGIPASTVTGGIGAAATGAGVGGIDDIASTLLAGSAGLGIAGATQFGGHALKNKAAQIAQDEADALVRLVATGSLDKLPMAERAGPPTRRRLIELFAKQALLKGGSRVGGPR